MFTRLNHREITMKVIRPSFHYPKSKDIGCVWGLFYTFFFLLRICLLSVMRIMFLWYKFGKRLQKLVSNTIMYRVIALPSYHALICILEIPSSISVLNSLQPVSLLQCDKQRYPTVYIHYVTQRNNQQKIIYLCLPMWSHTLTITTSIA